MSDIQPKYVLGLFKDVAELICGQSCITVQILGSENLNDTYKFGKVLSGFVLSDEIQKADHSVN